MEQPCRRKARNSIPYEKSTMNEQRSWQCGTFQNRPVVINRLEKATIAQRYLSFGQSWLPSICLG